MNWEDTCWGWLTLFNKRCPCLPSIEKKIPVSSGQIKRMLQNHAITINGKKPGPDDEMPDIIWELVFCKGSNSQCSIFWDAELAPVGATWFVPIHRKIEANGTKLERWEFEKWEKRMKTCISLDNPPE